MATIVKLFENGGSQSVRLPREFWFEGDRVRVRRRGRGVLLEPIFANVSEWFAELDRLAADTFMPEGRQQAPTIVQDPGGTSNANETAKDPELTFETWTPPTD